MAPSPSMNMIRPRDGKKGKAPKPPRKKKISQRGLGVAQLEKIRLEEQQKRQALAGAASSSCYMVPINSNFKPVTAIPTFMIPPTSAGHGLRPQPPPLTLKSTPMVRVSSSLSLEPPSNQIYPSNNISYSYSTLQNKEKIVGMKRPWPYSHDNPPGKAFSPSKIPAIHPSLCRWNDSSSHGQLGKLKLEQGAANMRVQSQQHPSSSSNAYCKLSKVTNGCKRVGSLDGAFLTLSTPRPDQEKPFFVQGLFYCDFYSRFAHLNRAERSSNK